MTCKIDVTRQIKIFVQVPLSAINFRREERQLGSSPDLVRFLGRAGSAVKVIGDRGSVPGIIFLDFGVMIDNRSAGLPVIDIDAGDLDRVFTYQQIESVGFSGLEQRGRVRFKCFCLTITTVNRQTHLQKIRSGLRRKQIEIPIVSHIGLDFSIQGTTVAMFVDHGAYLDTQSTHFRIQPLELVLEPLDMHDNP